MKLIEYYDEHWYKKTDTSGKPKYYPSITTKIGIIRKPFLERWRGDNGNRECDMRLFEAQERGSRIHHAWYTLTQGGVVVYNNWKRPVFITEELDKIREDAGSKGVAILQYQDEMVDAWKLQQFMGIVKPEIVASEMVLYSDKYMEAGTTDNIFNIKAGSYLVNGARPVDLDGGIYIADLKTGTVFSEDTYMQTAAYASMYNELTGKEVVGTLGLHTQAKTKRGIEGFAVYSRTRAQVAQDFKDFRHVSEVWLSKNKTEGPRTFEFPSMLKL